MRYIVLQCLLLPPRTSSFKMHAESLFKAKFRFGKEPNLHGHIFPFMCTSSSSGAHLSLHGHIFPFMGTSSFMAHLPLHGHIFPFMGSSTSSWPPLPLHGRIFPFVGTSITGRHFVQKWLSLGYRFGYRSKPETFQEK